MFPSFRARICAPIFKMLPVPLQTMTSLVKLIVLQSYCVFIGNRRGRILKCYNTVPFLISCVRPTGWRVCIAWNDVCDARLLGRPKPLTWALPPVRCPLWEFHPQTRKLYSTPLWQISRSGNEDSCCNMCHICSRAWQHRETYNPA